MDMIENYNVRGLLSYAGVSDPLEVMYGMAKPLINRGQV
jgi:hypothetical protein